MRRPDKDENKNNVNNEKYSKNKEASTSNEKKIFKVGEEALAGKHGVTILNVSKGYEKNTFFKPVNGYQLILVNVKIKNRSNSRISYSSSDFKIKDKHGNIVRQEWYDYGKGLGRGELDANGEVYGTLTFQVPKEDNDFSILYDPAFIFSKEVEIKI